MSRYHVQGRLFEGPLDAPTRNEYRAGETNDRAEAMEYGRNLARCGLTVWVYGHDHQQDRGRPEPWELVATIDPE